MTARKKPVSPEQRVHLAAEEALRDRLNALCSEHLMLMRRVAALEARRQTLTSADVSPQPAPSLTREQRRQARIEGAMAAYEYDGIGSLSNRSMRAVDSRWPEDAPANEADRG